MLNSYYVKYSGDWKNPIATCATLLVHQSLKTESATVFVSTGNSPG